MSTSAYILASSISFDYGLGQSNDCQDRSISIITVNGVALALNGDVADNLW